MTTMTFADVAEGVRATIARYTQALDDGRADDVVATYCKDGAFELPGTGTRRSCAEPLPVPSTTATTAPTTSSAPAPARIHG